MSSSLCRNARGLPTIHGKAQRVERIGSGPAFLGVGPAVAVVVAVGVVAEAVAISVAPLLGIAGEGVPRGRLYLY